MFQSEAETKTQWQLNAMRDSGLNPFSVKNIIRTINKTGREAGE